MPVLVNPSRFTVPGGTPGAGYAAAVLADSPWGFWEHTETTGTTLADATANARNMTLTGSGWTFNQTGPAASMPAILWPNGDNNFASTAANFSGSPGTIELWFFLTANPSVVLNLAACQNNGGGSFAKALTINTNGTIAFQTGVILTSAGAVSLNTWHHAVASVGAAGTKLRLDKTTVATNAATTSATNSLPATLHRRTSGTGANPGAVLSTAAYAIWQSQLSDAATDAHYDAMLA